MRGAVVPLVRAGDAVIHELIADGFPGLATIVGALHELAEPSAGLRGIDAVGINGRAFQVIKLEAGKVRAGDIPLFALTVRGEDECAFFRANQKANTAHTESPFPGSENLYQSADSRQIRLLLLEFLETFGSLLYFCRKVFHLEDLADFNDFVGCGGATLRPVDGFLPGIDPDHPVTAEDFLGLDVRAVGDDWLTAVSY